MDQTTSVPQVPQSSGGTDVRGRFTGKAGDFFRLLLAGMLLQIPTFGFYRFWLITDVRRHLWASTRIGDEPLEYTGTAKEILVGFLIALAILLPVYIVYFIATLEAEQLVPFAGTLLFVVFYVFGHYAIYRARRYRATRTTFRGLRFWMSGSAWVYCGKAALWDLATVLSLGLAYPWRAAALERYKTQNTHYGDLTGGFTASGRDFFRRGVWLWLVGLVLLLAVVGLSVSAIRGNDVQAVLGIATVLLVLAAIGIFPLFSAIEIKWRMSGYRFGEVVIMSTIQKRDILGWYLMGIIAIGAYAVAGVAVLGGSAYGSATLLGLEPGEGMTFDGKTIAGLLLIAVIYLVFILGLGLIKRLVIDRGVWKALALSLRVSNVEVLDRVAAAGGVPPSGLGEGLADALDVGAI